MAVKIRLKRMGNRNRPFYRLVVSDSRARRDGETLEDLGWYDPVKQPAQMSFKEESILKWINRGAQLSETARSLLKRAGILGKSNKAGTQDATESPSYSTSSAPSEQQGGEE